MTGQAGEFFGQVFVVLGAIYGAEIEVLGEGGGHGNLFWKATKLYEYTVVSLYLTQL